MVRAGGRKGSLAWRCQASGCGKVFISGSQVEKWITEALLQRADNVDWSAVVKRDATPTQAASALIDELAALESRDHELAAMFARGSLGPSQYETASGAIEADRRDAKLELAKLTTSATIQPFLSRSGALRASWNRLDDAGRPVMPLEAKRAVLAFLLGRVAVAPPVKRGSPRFDPARLSLLGAETD